MPVFECSRCNELYYSAQGSSEQACDACGAKRWRVFEDEVSFARVVGLPRDFQPGDHGAILFTETAAAADFCAAYLREGLVRGELTRMVVPTQLRDAVHSRLEPGEASAIEVDEPASHYFDFEPRAVAERLAGVVRASERAFRLLYGPDAASVSGVTADEWRHYERVCHQLVVELSATVLCAYDARNLPITFSPVAIEAHPLVSRGGDELRRNTDFSYEPASA